VSVIALLYGGYPILKRRSWPQAGGSSTPTDYSHPPTRSAVARRRAGAYTSLSKQAPAQRSSYDLTLAFPSAEASAVEKLLTRGCRNNARTMNGIPAAAGKTQNAVWGNLFQSGRFLPLST
jgi:hypothetical protein